MTVTATALRHQAQTGAILDRLVGQTRRILQVEHASVLLGDARDQEQSFAASIVAPIRVRGRDRGALLAATTSPGRDFDASDRRLLAELAGLAAAAVEHAEMRERLGPSAGAGAEVLTGTAEGGFHALAAAINARDGYDPQTSQRMVDLGRDMGERLELEPAALVELEFALRLHDVGKIAVPEAVLQAAGALSTEMWDVVKRHPLLGAEMLARVPGLELVAAIVRFHHERWDGSGYPDGLAAERIPVESRIVHVCDAFRGMTAKRPYGPAMAQDEVLRELEAGAGTAFCPTTVRTLIDSVTARSGTPAAA